MRKKRRKKRTWNVPVVGKKKVIIRTYTSSNKKRRNHKAENKKKQKKQPCLSLFFFGLLYNVARRAGVSSTLGLWSYPNEKKKSAAQDERTKQNNNVAGSDYLSFLLFSTYHLSVGICFELSICLAAASAPFFLCTCVSKLLFPSNLH